jgi:8-oxo-dGTP diphosphatase
MAEYVVGFMFKTNMKQVVLIKKKRPEWQNGKLNGVGGRVEPGENPYAAMAREFKEETCVYFDGWKFFCTLAAGSDKIYFAVASSGSAEEVSSPTEEEVFLIDVGSVEDGSICVGLPMPDPGFGEVSVAAAVHNLPWLVRMAIDSLANEVAYGVDEQRWL